MQRGAEAGDGQPGPRGRNDGPMWKTFIAIYACCLLTAACFGFFGFLVERPFPAGNHPLTGLSIAVWVASALLAGGPVLLARPLSFPMRWRTAVIAAAVLSALWFAVGRYLTVTLP